MVVKECAAILDWNFQCACSWHCLEVCSSLRCYNIVIFFCIMPTWLRLKPCSTSCFARHNGRHNIAITLIYIILYTFTLVKTMKKKTNLFNLRLVLWKMVYTQCISCIAMDNIVLRRLDLNEMDSIGGYYRDRPDRYMLTYSCFRVQVRCGRIFIWYGCTGFD